MNQRKRGHQRQSRLHNLWTHTITTR